MSIMDTAVQQVLAFDKGQAWTPAQVQERCALILQMHAGMDNPDEAPSAEALIRNVQARVNVLQDDSTALMNSIDHVDWLSERRLQIKWEFWKRYRVYLQRQMLPPAVIQQLDRITDSILGKLEDPTRSQSWDRRGLVVGQVQSGKTGNYTALICKAADAGYKLIVVLAGVHNSLRSQTQLRLDEGFLGFDTQYLERANTDGSDQRIGAGKIIVQDMPRAGSLTTSKETGDFRVQFARRQSLPIGNDPVLLVVKKHTGILENIRAWVTSMEGETVGGRQVVAKVPLLVIDDEADNASIDTSKDIPETDPTGTNKAIRLLLNTFDRSAYVGYTATPYANIYADTATDQKFGPDLFPSSFIESLRAPSNYLGAERVFGLDATGSKPLPIHREVGDAESWMPGKHDKSWPVDQPLPESLSEAVRAFLLVCAARRARGDVHVHNSMLVHVTRLQDVQHRVVAQLDEELADLQSRIHYGDGDRPSRIIEELKWLWDRDFIPTSEKMREDTDSVTVWSDVLAHLPAAVIDIKTREINGKAKDALEYYEKRDKGLSVIAVGGDKLSRGLTLEGLSVSYYLRTTRMYDTLMQMGRWFGYRPNYEDLCRLYTTPELRKWYREITLAEAELREEFEEMAAQDEEPSSYGLRVRTSTAGLMITAANKMRRSQKMRLSFSGANPETTAFTTSPEVLESNLAALDELTRAAEAAASAEPIGEHRLWRKVEPEKVIRFLEQYRGARGTNTSHPDLIARYLRQTTDVFPAWDVVLISNSQAAEGQRRQITVGRIGMTTRALHGKTYTTASDDGGDFEHQNVMIRLQGRYAVRRVLSPPHEMLNLDQNQHDAALEATIQAWREDPKKRGEPKIPSGPQIRRQRRRDQGLLVLYVLDNTGRGEAVSRPMVGFLLSFPFAGHEESTREYAVNTVFRQQLDLLADLEDESDDD